MTAAQIIESRDQAAQLEKQAVLVAATDWQAALDLIGRAARLRNQAVLAELHCSEGAGGRRHER